MENKILDKFPEFNNNWPTDLRIEWLKQYANLIHSVSQIDKSQENVVGFNTK